jgi:hypothetical protein
MNNLNNLIDSKLAFRIIKILEAYALSVAKEKKIATPIDYELILLLPNDYPYRDQTLILSATWLDTINYAEPLQYLNALFKEKKIPSLSIVFMHTQSINIDLLAKYADNLPNTHYLAPFSNVEIRDEQIESGFVLKSKLLPQLKYGTVLKTLYRKNPFALPQEEEFIFIDCQGLELLALPADFWNQYNSNQPLNQQPKLFMPNNHIKLSLYNIFELKNKEAELLAWQMLSE